MDYYNKLKDDSEVLRYYRSVLSELKTKRFRASNESKALHLDSQIKELEIEIKKLTKD